MEKSTILQDLWKRYQAQNLYARKITYFAVMETVKEFTEKMNFCFESMEDGCNFD